MGRGASLRISRRDRRYAVMSPSGGGTPPVSPPSPPSPGNRGRAGRVIRMMMREEDGTDRRGLPQYGVDVLRVVWTRVDHDGRIPTEDPRVGPLQREWPRVWRQDPQDLDG